MVCCRGGYERNAATDRLASLLCVPIVNTAIITNNRNVLEGVNIRSCQDEPNPYIDAIVEANASYLKLIVIIIHFHDLGVKH